MRVYLLVSREEEEEEEEEQEKNRLTLFGLATHLGLVEHQGKSALRLIHAAGCHQIIRKRISAEEESTTRINPSPPAVNDNWT